jgi:hypothetical protein
MMAWRTFVRIKDEGLAMQLIQAGRVGVTHPKHRPVADIHITPARRVEAVASTWAAFGSALEAQRPDRG